MKIKKTLTKCILSIISLGMILPASYVFAMQEVSPQQFQMPQLSEAQMKKMEQAVEQFNNYYESLTEADQVKLRREMETQMKKEYEKLKRMSPKQQQRYLQQAVEAYEEATEGTSEMEIGEEYVSTPIPELTTPDTKKKKPESQDQSDKAKVKKTVELLDKLIDAINDLSVKFGTIQPNPQALIDRWLQPDKGYIQRWAGVKSSGNLFMDNFNIMKSILSKLKATDPKTKEYLYIGDPKKTEKLVGELSTLKTMLEKYKDKIEVTEKGEVKEIEAKEALKKLINYLADTSTIIAKSIIELIKEFDPEAVKKEEERLEKIAARVAKKEKEMVSEADISYDLDDTSWFGRGRDDYGDFRRRGYGRPTRYRKRRRPYKPYKKTTKRKGKAPSPEKDKTAKQKTKEPEKKPVSKKEEEKEDKEKKLRKDEVLNEYLKSLTKGLDSFSNNMENVLEKDLKSHVEEAIVPNPDFVKQIADAENNIIQAIRNIRTAKRKINKIEKDEVKKAYKTELKKIADAYKGTLGEIKTNLKKIDKRKLEEGPKFTMKYTFFGGTNRDKIIAELAKRDDRMPGLVLEPETIPLTDVEKQRLDALKAISPSFNIEDIIKKIDYIQRMLK